MKNLARWFCVALFVGWQINISYSKERNACYNSVYNNSKGEYSLFEKYGIKKDCVYEELDRENENLKFSKKVDFDITLQNIKKRIICLNQN